MDDNIKGKAWVGTSMEEIYGKYGPWNYSPEPINPSRSHFVFYEIDTVNLKRPPKPFLISEKTRWDYDHVRMPFSEKNLFPVEKDDGTKALKSRWEIIQTALLQPIRNSRQLEALISTYNTRLPKFAALHHFFEEVLDEEESKYFFDSLLPEIINFALQLPHLVQKSIPLLRQGSPSSVSLTQMQIASLLANGFLCTFPWRKDLALSYPGINFIRLFSAHLRPKRVNCVANKLKCICHYFRRVLSKNPVGVVTFERKSFSKSLFPRWDRQENILGNTRVHVCSAGRIEDAKGLLQVDFANKYVGGGVIGYGCVQEEIRYIICPELIVSRLFTECLTSNEALLITGAERYSNYEGYGDDFKWSGNCEDQTPYDNYGRRRTSIVAIDAIRFNKSSDQFLPSMILRELNKAYVGYYSWYSKPLPAVATGNWGCGAYKGNPHLKFLIQLIACSATRRNMVYFTFSNEELRDSIHSIYNFIVANQIRIDKLWRYLTNFSSSKLREEHLLSYLHQAHLDSKKLPSVSSFPVYKKHSPEDIPSTSRDSSRSHLGKRASGMTSPPEQKQPPKPGLAKRVTEQKTLPSESKRMEDGSKFEMDTCPDGESGGSDNDDIIESSQEEQFRFKMDCSKFYKTKRDSLNNHLREEKSEALISIIERMDGKVESSSESQEEILGTSSFFMKIDKFSNIVQEENSKKNAMENKEEKLEASEEIMEIDIEEGLNRIANSKNGKPQKKITDFFTKIDIG